MDAEYFLRELFTLVFMLLLMAMMVMTSILGNEVNIWTQSLDVGTLAYCCDLSCNFVESDDSIELLHRQGPEHQI